MSRVCARACWSASFSSCPSRRWLFRARLLVREQFIGSESWGLECREPHTAIMHRTPVNIALISMIQIEGIDSKPGQFGHHPLPSPPSPPNSDFPMRSSPCQAHNSPRHPSEQSTLPYPLPIRECPSITPRSSSKPAPNPSTQTHVPHGWLLIKEITTSKTQDPLPRPSTTDTHVANPPRHHVA